MNIQPHRALVLLVAFLGVAVALLGTVIKPSYQIRYNTSQSAPIGWYAIVPRSDLPVGAFALARLPVAAAALADERGYLPKTVPILKRVGAAGGQSVCARGNQIVVDGVTVGRSLSHDGQGRYLAAWRGCRRLAAGELFLLNPENAASFDSRYFGPIPRADVIGKAIPLWTR
jgi:conjugative transfer signal peptidase TraF